MFALPAPVPPVIPLIVTGAFAPAPQAWLPAHRGVDLKARVGQPVRAPDAAVVAFVDRVAGRPVLALRSGGVRYTFEPVAASVVVGERIRAGETIGTVAAGGHCDGRCLHWGAKVDGQYVDPMSFLPRRTPVLKPVPRTAPRAIGDR